MQIELISIDKVELPETRLTSDLGDEGSSELMESIRAWGVLVPIQVKRTPTGYILIDGFNRLMASKGIGNNVIPATIFTPAETPVDLLNLVTNLHRGTSTPYEEALVIHQTLTNRGTDDITLARMLNRSVVWIKSRLHLLSLPDDIQSLLAENSIPVSTATELSNIENPELRKQITRRVIDFGASARETKAWVNQLNASELTNQTRVSTLGTVLALNKNPDLKLTCFACDQEFNPSSLKSQLICTTCEKLLSGEGETGSPQAEISPPA